MLSAGLSLKRILSFCLLPYKASFFLSDATFLFINLSQDRNRDRKIYSRLLTSIIYHILTPFDLSIISSNGIGAEGAKSLGESIAKLVNLTSLTLNIK